MRVYYQFIKCAALFITIFFSYYTSSAQWVNLGPDDSNPVSLTPTIGYSSAVDEAGNIYLAYISETPETITVRKCTNGIWKTIPTPFQIEGYELCIKINPYNKLPYLLISDKSNNNKTTLVRYNGSAWDTIGRPGFSNVSVDGFTLDFDKNGNVFTAFRDSSNGFKGNVMQFINNQWQYLGTPNFTDTLYNFSFALDKNDVPYLAYRRGSSKAHKFLKYVNQNWVEIDNPIPAWYMEISMAFDPVNKINIAYSDTVGNYLFFDGSKNDTIAQPSQGMDVQLSIGKQNKIISFIDNFYNAAVYSNNSGLWYNISDTSLNGVGALSHLIGPDDNCIVSYLGGIGNQTIIKKYDGSKWVNIGNSGIGNGEFIQPVCLGFDSANSPRLYSLNGNFNNYLSITQFKNNSWNEFFKLKLPGVYFSYPDLVINPDDSKIIVFSDTTKNYSLTILKLINGAWQRTGSPLLNSVSISDPKAALDSKGNIYVTFRDDFLKNVSVVKFDTNSCSYVGKIGIASKEVKYPNIIIDKDDQPIISFTYHTFDHDSINVMKYNGTNWVLLGEQIFNNTPCASEQLIKDNIGKIYLLYDQEDSVNRLNLLSFNGTKWINVASTVISDTTAIFLNITFDKNNVPYVAYADYNYDSKLTIRTLKGQDWVTVGNPGISSTPALYATLACRDNKIYVVYSTGYCYAKEYTFSALPLNFISFTAIRNSSDVKLNWQVSDPVDCNQYIIQRSFNGMGFNDVATIRSTDHTEYSFIDKVDSNEDVYYRIIAVSKANEKIYSNIILLKHTAETKSFNIYPNPVFDRQVNVELKNMKSGTYKLSIVNNGGLEVSRFIINYFGGNYSKNILLPQTLSSGYYTINLSRPGKAIVLKKLIIIN